MSERFRRWGEQIFGQLPMYGTISVAVADDPEVRDLLLQAPPEQRLPVLLFAAVHFLLLVGAQHPLSRRYPTVGGSADVADDPYPDFRDFVLGRRADLVDLMSSRSTQTNEIGRCAVLRPAWQSVVDEVDAPLGLVELGSSAGLNLLLDRWAYSYSPDGPDYGDPARTVLVEAQSRGTELPRLHAISIGDRVGIDRDPIDVTDDEAARWLQACVWAEQLPRFERLRAAIQAARTQPPRLIAGDIVASVVSVAAEVGSTQHLAVQNSWVLNYLTPDARERLMTELAGIGAERDLSWLSIENPEFTANLDFPPRPDGIEESGATVAVLSTWRSGRKSVRRLADCHPHGTWLRWW